MGTDARPTAYDVAGRYDEAYYEDLAGRYLGRSRFARRRVDNVLSLLPPLAGLRLVDLGCGMGTFTIEAARRGARAMGVDMSAAALPAAARVAAAEGAPGTAGSATFVRADAAQLPLADGGADLVLAADLTEHLDDGTLAAVLAEAARVLGGSGCLVLYSPSPSHVLERLRDRGVLRDRDPSHIGMRGPAELARALQEAGFRVVRTEFLPSHLPGLDLLERAMARRVPLLRRRIGMVAEPAGNR